MAAALSKRKSFVPPWIATAWRWIVSFEMVFVLYFYSNLFQPLLPPLPVDLTIVLVLVAMAWSGVIILREGVYVRGLTLVLALLPFCFWSAMSIGWSLSRTLGYDYVVILLTINLWCFAASALVLSKDRERMMRFLVLMTVMALIIATLGLGIYARYGSFKFAGWVDAGRIYNTWGRGTANGAIVLLLVALLARPGSLKSLTAGGLLGICILFLFVASSRSALLSFVAASMMCFFVYLPRLGRGTVEISRVQLFFMLGAVVAVVAVAYALNSGAQIDTINRFQTLQQQAEDPDMVSGPNRFAYIDAALRYIYQSPIWGHGVGTYSILFYGREVPGAHPHNTILEILVAGGAIGLILFLLPVWLAVRNLSLGGLRNDPLLLCVTMLFASRVVAAMVGADLSTQQPVFIFWGMLALRRLPQTDAAAAAAPRRRRAGLAIRRPLRSSRA